MSELEKIEFCLACSSSSSTEYCETNSMMVDIQEVRKWKFHQCNDCGLIFLNPRVKAEYLSNYYRDYYLPYRGPKAWGSYEELVASDLKKVDSRRINLTKNYLKKSAKVLDIGCGQPTFLQQLYEKYNVHCTGVDFSNEGWKNSNEFKDLNLIQSDPKEIHYDLKFDVVTMWHYLEHDYKPLQTLSNLKKMLHQGSRIIIEVPNHDSYSRKKFKNNWSGYHTPRHTALYNESSMKTLLSNSGFEVESFRSYGSLDPYTLDWMSRMEVKGIDWSKNFESDLFSFVLGKIFRPIYFFHKFLSLGFMTVIARPKF